MGYIEGQGRRMREEERRNRQKEKGEMLGEKRDRPATRQGKRTEGGRGNAYQFTCTS